MNEAVKKSDRDRGIILKKDRKGEWRYYARIVVTRGDGSTRQIAMLAENKTHARRLREKMLRNADTQGSTYLDGEKLKFRQLAEDYKSRKLVPAKYHNGRKVAGLRSLNPVLSSLLLLIKFFGNQLIRQISPADIERYKQTRLDTPITKEVKTESGTETVQRPRAIASVNRELALLRSIFNDAVANSLLLRSPFQGAKGVVSLADEVRRERVLTFAEEKLLLDACTNRLRVEYERAGKKIVAHQGSSHEINDNTIEKNEVVFFNWESLIKTNNVFRLDNERDWNLKTVCANTRDEGRKIVLIIDESHRTAKASKAKDVISEINPVLVIEMTATPSELSGTLIEIPLGAVIAEGMIKKEVRINPYAPGMSDDRGLLDIALKTRAKLKDSYSALGKYINPLLLIQVPDKRAGEASNPEDHISGLLADRGYLTSRGNLAVWLSDKKENRDNPCAKLRGIP